MFCTEFPLNDDNNNDDDSADGDDDDDNSGDDDDSTDGDDSGDSDGGCVALLPLLVRYDWPATALLGASLALQLFALSWW